MQKYKCHKEVMAAKIIGMDIYSASNTGRLLFGDYSVGVNEEYLEKHGPKLGGYYVKYSDGYESYSPAEAFESGYTLIGGNNIPKFDITTTYGLEDVVSVGSKYFRAHPDDVKIKQIVGRMPGFPSAYWKECNLDGTLIEDKPNE